MSDCYPLLHQAEPTWLDLEIFGRCLRHSDTMMDFYRDPASSKSPLVYAWVCKVQIRDLSRCFSVTAYSLHSPYVQYVLHFPAMSVSAYSLSWSFGKWPVTRLKLSQLRNSYSDFSLVSRLVSPGASPSPPMASCSNNTAVKSRTSSSVRISSVLNISLLTLPRL